MAGQAQIKYLSIVERLRQEIVAGRFPPGGRLPSQVELAAHYQVSGLTIQRVTNVLVEDGFIRTGGKRGTFVVGNPPHLSRYALIFPSHPADRWGIWNRFWTALANEAEAVNRLLPGTVDLFYDMEIHEDNENYRRLLSDVRSQRLAGLMFAFPPEALLETPLLADPKLPKAAIMAPNPRQPNLPVVSEDGRSFLDRAVEYLAGQDRQRVALLTVPGHSSDDYLRHFEAIVEKHGMATRPYWTQVVSQNNAKGIRNAAHILSLPIQSPTGQVERPDALIITDDNLVEHASGGLVAAGVRVPEDVAVVGHCNFPWPPPSALPIKRLGFDARATLRLLMARIDSQRRGEEVPLCTDIPAVFEDEIESTVEYSLEHLFPGNPLSQAQRTTQHRRAVRSSAG